jgi:hypothetical protein
MWPLQRGRLLLLLPVLPQLVLLLPVPALLALLQ